MSSLPQQAELWQSTLNWAPSDRQQSQFQTLYREVLSGNQRLNLTRITEPEEFWEKHLWDSLRGIFPGEHLADLASDAPIQAIDIGTGAGFPGLPVAIAQPHWQLKLVDSTRKKIQFIQETLLTLKMTNVRCLVDRAEALGQDPQHRERYDLALIRAVSTASVCAEYVIPLLKVGGSAVLYRGQWTEAEGEDLEVALEVLGAKLVHCDRFTTPLTDGQRTCLILRKTEPTPLDYPRAIGIPTQHPIVA
jgi:16S rRNA (guanine527-N7)-methyltransferase